MNEREEAVDILAKFVARWKSLANPLCGGWLVFDICVRRANCEDALSSGYTIRASLIAVVEVDTEDLSEAVAKFIRHNGQTTEAGWLGSRWFDSG